MKEKLLRMLHISDFPGEISDRTKSQYKKQDHKGFEVLA